MLYAFGALLVAAVGALAALLGKRKLNQSARVGIDVILERAKSDAERIAREQRQPFTEQEAINELRKTIDAGRSDN